MAYQTQTPYSTATFIWTFVVLVVVPIPETPFRQLKDFRQINPNCPLKKDFHHCQVAICPARLPDSMDTERKKQARLPGQSAASCLYAYGQQDPSRSGHWKTEPGPAGSRL